MNYRDYRVGPNKNMRPHTWPEVALATAPDEKNVREDLRVAGMILRGAAFPHWTPEAAHGEYGANWHQPISFRRPSQFGQVVVWQARKKVSEPYWQVADLIDGQFRNHRGVAGRSLLQTLHDES